MVHAGFITQSEADEINKLIEQTSRIRSDVNNLPDDDEEWFPIKVTATNASNACTWVERTWDETGIRADLTSGMYGDPTYNPAYPVGNGDLPVAPLPFDTWARRRIAVASVGDVFEFDWICACGVFNTASGSTGSPASGASGA